MSSSGAASVAIPIGYFQLDNLIRNRIPFLFFRTDLPIEATYGVMERMHIRNFSMVLENLTLDQAEVQLRERNARKEDPIVVLCETGIESKHLAEKFVEHGHLNVYYILGGWKSLQEEMKNPS